MDPKKPQPNPDPRSERPDEHEELAHYDDAVIGRAFRWSLVLLVVLAGCGVIVIWFVKRKPDAKPPQVTKIEAPQARPTLLAQIPEAKFTDITAPAGIRFVHVNGATGDKLLPESMGGGVGFVDFDSDGDPDLLFVNATFWPWDESEGKAKPKPALYRNDGAGQFEDVTSGSGLDVSLFGMGLAAGDYDNDGREDVFISAVGENRLFRNLGEGKFADVTAQAGVAGRPEEWSTSSAFIDYDNDGDLDLFVCNYVRWSREIDFKVGYTLTGEGRAYGPPFDFQGTFPYLYRNDGAGRFTDVSQFSGIHVTNRATGVPMAKSLGLAPADLDQDGWIDLIVANDTVPNFVFLNQRDGTFKEIGAISGVAYDNYGNTRGAMGIDAGYFRNDGALGVVIGNFANEMTALYVAQENGTNFTDEAIAQGIGPASRLLLKFGIFFFDYDLDGRLDVLSANGHLEEEISKVQQSQHYAQPAQLFWNSGRNQTATFQEVPSAKCGPDLHKPIVGRGSAYADMDGDGDLDVVLTQIGGPPLLLRNDQKLGHHWIRLRLIGKKTNRSAIGALVKVRAGGELQTRQVMPARSYLSQSELPVTFGLGTSVRIEAVEIVWPGGAVQTVPPDQIQINALTVIEEDGL